MLGNPQNRWICETEKTILSFPIMDVIERLCRSSENQKQFKFYLLRTNDWCNVIPITEDGKIVMVRQFRIGISDHTLELPGGVAAGEDEDAQATAIRELEEETGYVPMEGAKCIALGNTFPNPAMMNNQCCSFIVGPVRRTSTQNLDPGEMIEVVEIPISEIPLRILNGEINHALMLNAFFFLALQSEKISSILTGQMEKFSRTDISAQN